MTLSRVVVRGEGEQVSAGFGEQRRGGRETLFEVLLVHGVVVGLVEDRACGRAATRRRSGSRGSPRG
jgi:hypothetical protein